MKSKIIALLFACFLFVSCKHNNIITDFNPMSNFPDYACVHLDFDMTNSVFEGLTLPNKDSVFEFTFTISGKPDKKYYYKIFYQNITYAFEDNHPLSYENFYGSWADTDKEFKLAPSTTVKDSFKIVGNPRNEKKYFGAKFKDMPTQADIEDIMSSIKFNPKWYASVQAKAKENKISEKEQSYRDAAWTLNHDTDKSKEINRRERRNPRVGEYEFMLVVVEEDALKKIPDYIKNISKTKDSSFVNPFDYFRNKGGKNKKGVYVYTSAKHLKTRAKYDIAKGVYINRVAYPNYDFAIYENNPMVGYNDSLYRYAQFEEYYHNINTLRTIPQIQSIADIYDNGYTLEDYLKTENNANIITKNVHPFITDRPGKNIRVHNNTIELINPGNSSLEKARKENVGIKARIGFTYGKYIYKIKFPALLNRSGLWTGITNAAWLIYQNESEWNYRRKSDNGYVIENYNENESERINQTHYTEIDIEMIKTSPYWPAQEDKQKPLNEVRKDNKFVFAATNWDLACNDNRFISDKTLLFDKKYDGKTFTYNRWNKDSRNLTSRVEVSNDIFNEPYYYYVIEWKPKEIIWYIGKDLEHLTVVGYMSENFTSIPNNQMVPIITQEFHYSEFWPPVIFEQGLLPYPSKDIKGVLYELSVE